MLKTQGGDRPKTRVIDFSTKTSEVSYRGVRIMALGSQWQDHGGLWLCLSLLVIICIRQEIDYLLSPI
jgi:hypothetical protein